MEKTRILVVEDGIAIAEEIIDRLEVLGIEVPATATSGEDAIKKTEETRPDLVIMDIKLEGEIDGIEAARQIRDRFDVPVVYLTAFSDRKTLERAKVTEPFGYIIKPFEDRDLEVSIELALYKHEKEQALQKSEARFRNVLETLELIGLMLDTEGKITFCNDFLLDLTGWKRKEVLGMDWFTTFLPPEIRSKIKKSVFLKTIRNAKFPAHYGNEIITRNGERRSIAWNNTVSFDPEGNVIGVTSIGEDITARKKAEEDLQKAYDELKTLDEMKSRLVANVSHELRTPLAIARGAMELAKREKDPEERKELLDSAWNALERQNKVIGNLISAAKLDEKVELELEEVDLSDIIAPLSGEFKPLFERKKIKLELDVEDKLPKVTAEFESIKHVLSNLLDNAVKFTGEKGKITVVAKKENDTIKVCVKDTGKGISKANQKHIFKRFYQGDEIGYQGTGIGLAVANELVLAHGGKMSVTSAPDKGSTFCFTLSIAREK